MRKTVLNVPVWLWLAFLAFAAVFVAFPELDLWFSGLFYRPGEGFPTRGGWDEQLVCRSVGFLLLWGNLLLIALWLFNRFVSRSPGRFGGKELFFSLLLLAVAPGLIVNTLLKESWGRARPIRLEQFGGTMQFSPAFLPSDHSGGSFSSGHAAGAFYWVAVAALAARRRRVWVGLAMAYGVVVGLFRIAAGAHFLSDVLTSFFIVVIVGLMLHGLIFGASPPARRAVETPRG
jgi:lipid A 4'-phosphatase